MLCSSTKKDMRKSSEDFLNNQIGIKEFINGYQES